MGYGLGRVSQGRSFRFRHSKLSVHPCWCGVGPTPLQSSLHVAPPPLSPISRVCAPFCPGTAAMSNVDIWEVAGPKRRRGPQPSPTTPGGSCQNHTSHGVPKRLRGAVIPQPRNVFVLVPLCAASAPSTCTGWAVEGWSHGDPISQTCVVVMSVLLMRRHFVHGPPLPTPSAPVAQRTAGDRPKLCTMVVQPPHQPESGRVSVAHHAERRERDPHGQRTFPMSPPINAGDAHMRVRPPPPLVRVDERVCVCVSVCVCIHLCTLSLRVCVRVRGTCRRGRTRAGC